MIVAKMATVLRRRESLRRVIDTLIPQVDILYIYQNDYHEPIAGCRIVSENNPRDLGDIGKVFAVDPTGEFVLLVDDDILYPRDYARRMIDCCQSEKAIIGVHGALLRDKVKNYFVDRKVFHFASQVNHNIPVHVVGTGTVCYDASQFSIDHTYPKEKNMLDIFFSLKAQEEKKPIRIIERKRNWLRPAIEEDSASLYRTRGNGEKQTRWINTVRKWSTF
jgi:hypothetical protein